MLLQNLVSICLHFQELQHKKQNAKHCRQTCEDFISHVLGSEESLTRRRGTTIHHATLCTYQQNKLLNSRKECKLFYNERINHYSHYY